MTDENASAFLAAIDDIKAVDVSAERFQSFKSEDEFNGLSVELLIEVGSYIVVAANLLPGETRRWSRDQAIVGGHLVRLYKLVNALLDQICQHRREITFIVARLAFECIVNLRFLLKFASQQTFDSYIAYSLRQEKRLHNRIHANIKNRKGLRLPVEDRMLASIARVMNASAVNVESLSSSLPKNWGDKNLYERSEAIGLGEAYLGTFGGPSSSVHGNWMDLLEFQLETHHHDGNFSPSFEWRNPRPQIGQTVALLSVEAVRDYFNYVAGGSFQLMEQKFEGLSGRIREAMRAHEEFLIQTGAD